MTVTKEEIARRRAERRRRVQQRQTVIFGGLVSALLVIAIVAAAVWSGMLPVPFAREFSTAPGDADRSTPCPPADATTSPPNEITVNVLNGTNVSGLAASTASALVTTGVVVNREGNFTGGYEGTAQVFAGSLGLTAAYTLAAMLPEADVVLDTTNTTETVDLVLGTEFTALAPADQIRPVEPGTAITPPEGCTDVAVQEPAE